jgi:hypothetical protein
MNEDTPNWPLKYALFHTWLDIFAVFSKAKITFNEGKQFSLQKAYALPG